LHDAEEVDKTVNCSMLLRIKSHFQDILAKWGKSQDSFKFQDTFEISGISGQHCK